MYSVRQLEQRDKWEKRITIAIEQERILKNKLGYAEDQTTTMKNKYFRWLADNDIIGLKFKP